MITTPWGTTPPKRYGGTENMVDALCRGLYKIGHNVTLIAPYGSRCPVNKTLVKVGGYDQMGSATIEAPYAIRAYDELVVTADVDIIHDHTQVGFLIADTWGFPVITTNHNLFDAERQLIYREATRRGVGVVAISQHHAQTAKAADVPLIGWVHNGIDVDAVPIGSGGPYVCVLSRMSPSKGIRQAVEIAHKAGVPIKIAAKMQTSQEKHYFDDQVRPLLNGDDEFLSEVDAREKYELLGGALAMINALQPPWHEPFGMAMIESLACGTPVLATTRGSVPEIIDDSLTGFLRDPRDMSGLAADLVSIGELDRTVCRKVAEERFSMAHMAQRYVDLYETFA